MEQSTDILYVPYRGSGVWIAAIWKTKNICVKRHFTRTNLI